MAAAGGAAPTGTPPSYTAAPPAPPQPLFEASGTFGAPQWGIVDLSSHQHLFGGFKRGGTAAPGAPPAPTAPPDAGGKEEKGYFRRLKYFMERRFPCGVCQKSFKPHPPPPLP